MKKQKQSLLIKGRKWTDSRIKNLLSCNLAAAKKAVVIIYKNQTEDEKESKSTVNKNGIGFTGFDADVLTPIAEDVMQNKELSLKQENLLLGKMPKYHKQIFNYMKNLLYN